MFIICKCIYKFIWRFLERCLVITLSMICHWHGTPWFTMASRYKLNKHVTRRGGKGPQGPHSHILMTGESEGFFWVWHFGQKGFFWVYERRRDFFGSRKQHRDFFWVLYFSSFESELRYDDEKPYRLAQVLRMCCLTSTRRRTEYVKPVNLQRDSVKNIQLLVKPYKLLHDHVFARSSVTEEVGISDVISPVSLTRRREEFQLSLADATYLEAYFPLDNYGDTSEYMADDGRRVQLSRTRTGWLRRAVVYTAY